MKRGVRRFSFWYRKATLTEGVTTMTVSDSNKATKSSNKEDAALRQFKVQIHDLLKPEHDDYHLKKWLKARNYDVGKAVEMFRASMEYRKKMNVDKLLTEYEPPEVLKKYLPGGFAGFDKEGSPILIELFGYLDTKGILASCRKSDIEKTKLLLGEQVTLLLDQQSQKLGKRVDGMTVIIDMDKVGASLLWGPAMQMIAHMGKVVQDNYPEVVTRSYIVNAPKIFPLLWRMIRPLVSEEMKKKVCILGADYRKELLKNIDAAELPEFLGGTMKDPDGDPRCPSRICQGGKVPEEYFLKELLTTDHMQSGSVSRGSHLQLDYDVRMPGSLLRWEFKTDGYDIGFGITYHGRSGREEVIKVDRVASHVVPEDGMHACARTGKYTVTFDNRYSWARSKTIYYNIEVVLPEDLSTVADLDAVTQGGSWERVADRNECTHL